ncbi:ABC transporter substrate-binding protein [Paenibacillus donghaensis]|uniref:ABC transporter substrate-binding protein n=1 Tax=Paenibacillus donghaensis TaxID=414771 RepID=A0A2Z2KEK9_9BACL|nr:extracellular solute-binding protein [Paenibacillus donghaensis]ASA25206.1 hypothetical protein B9T62_33420 [Paenibacillus donghaensis]
MKRIWTLIFILCMGGLAGYALLYERPLTTDYASISEDGSAPRTQIKVALYNWTENLEVKNAIQQYNRTNADHIEIVIMNISTDAYNDTLNMLMTAGQGPDVFSVDNAWLATYVNKNYLADLSGSLDNAFLSRFPQWAVRYAAHPLFKGGLYFLPSSVETVRFIYNKQLFRSAGLDPEQPPADYAELERAARRISEAGFGVNRYGFALAAGDTQDSLQAGLEMSSTYSGEYLYNYKTGRYDLGVYAPWLQMLLAMKAEGSLYPGESLLKKDTALRQFADGNIGMMAVTSRDYAKLQEYKPKDEWAVVLPPAASSSSRGAGALMMVPQSPLVVNSKTADREAAVKVWRFMQSEDFLSTLFQQGLALPVVEGILDSPRTPSGLAHFQEFFPTAADSIYPLAPQIMDQYDPNTVSIEPRNSGERSRMQLYLQIISGEKPLREALRGESERLNQMLDIADTGYVFNREEYTFPGFDPQQPLDSTSLSDRASEAQQ